MVESVVAVYPTPRGPHARSSNTQPSALDVQPSSTNTAQRKAGWVVPPPCAPSRRVNVLRVCGHRSRRVRRWWIEGSCWSTSALACFTASQPPRDSERCARTAPHTFSTCENGRSDVVDRERPTVDGSQACGSSGLPTHVGCYLTGKLSRRPDRDRSFAGPRRVLSCVYRS